MNNSQKEVSLQTLRRLPVYLDFLQSEYKKGVLTISTPYIASHLGLTEILVKKDLMLVITKSGKPKIGHQTIDLINDIKQYLGYNDVSSAVLVGAGKLGKALLGYEGFKKWNMEIVVAFDKNPNVINTEVNHIKILDINDLEKLCKRMNIHIGIITTDVASAQDVCNRLIASGVKAIWNFAPANLKVPEGIIIQNENLASSLAILSKKLEKII